MNAPGASEKEIRALLASYEQALNASDVDAAVAVYAADGVFYPYNLPTVTGTSELRASYQEIFTRIRLEIAFDVHEIVIGGDLGYATTSSKGKVTVLAENLTAPEENREVFVFTRASGKWKVARYMFNKPAAPAV